MKNFNHTFRRKQLISRTQTARGTVVHSATPKNVTGDLKEAVQTLTGISIVRACVVIPFFLCGCVMNNNVLITRDTIMVTNNVSLSEKLLRLLFL